MVCPLPHPHCCNFAPDAVEPDGTSRHIPLFATANWYVPAAGNVTASAGATETTPAPSTTAATAATAAPRNLPDTGPSSLHREPALPTGSARSTLVDGVGPAG
ncbi:hypothetical protein Kpho01_01010 [Kitasatospora phosalacinea]|uniref:Uncharacterized protein n=1 Tax=Kitasatospora phosalacinea TaxID=2065 RepID=A0A9W6PBI2_9ACTN|nr:hypothetical protein Kpho01_01010 [Kitasatospora phosalacinea]